jgi:hypothetical protein
VPPGVEVVEAAHREPATTTGRARQGRGEPLENPGADGRTRTVAQPARAPRREPWGQLLGAGLGSRCRARPTQSPPAGHASAASSSSSVSQDRQRRCPCSRPPRPRCREADVPRPGSAPPPPRSRVPARRHRAAGAQRPPRQAQARRSARGQAA